MKAFPLLQSQLGVLLQSMQRPDSTQYNLPNYIFMPLALTSERVVRAVRRLIDHYPVLHTRYVTGDGGEVLQWCDLTDDLTTALTQLTAGQTIDLPRKTHSFAYWTEAVSRYRDSYLLQTEQPYWQHVQEQIEGMERTEPGAHPATRQLTVTLDGEPLRQLLTTSARAYNTEINDLLIAALCQSYHQLTGTSSLSILMEGHGREPLQEPVITDRTVGWFTAAYPLIAEGINGEVRHDVRLVKELLRAVPYKGIGYGILQYVASQEKPIEGAPAGNGVLRTDLTPLVGFNYLGEVDDTNDGKALLATDSSLLRYQAPTTGQLGIPLPSIDINCAVADGRLVARFEYDSERWTADRVQQLADTFTKDLAGVAAHTASVSDSEQKGRYEAFVRQLLRRDRKAGLAYWKGLLADYDTRAAIPSYEQPAGSPAKPHVRHPLDKQLSAALRQLASKTGVTLNTVMELGWGLTLQSYGRTEDVVFARVVSGRESADGDNSSLVGLFINSVLVRVQASAGATVTQALKALQQQSAQSAAYSFCPLSEILAQTRLGSSLFQSIVAFENYPVDNTLLEANQKWGVKPVQIEEEPFGELAVSIVPEREGTLALTLTYDTAMYTEQQMEQAAALYETILTSMAAMPEGQIGELPLVTPAAATQLTTLGQGERMELDAHDTLVSLFRRQAATTPDAIAVVYGQQRMTYGQIDALTDRLAYHLINNYQVQTEEAVGVMIDRSELMVIYPLAIMKAGACYMPLDASLPADRLQYMCREAGVRLILSECSLVAQAMPGYQVNIFKAEQMEALDHVTAPLPQAEARHRFVILYTSGSTGTPKGIEIEHHSIVNYCHWHHREYRLTAADRVLGFSNFSFDAHMIDIYPTLTVGASVYIIGSDMRMDLTYIVTARLLSDLKHAAS